MNGIIHNCSHGDPDDDAFKLTEDQMFHDICEYIATLFRIIKPRLLLLSCLAVRVISLLFY